MKEIKLAVEVREKAGSKKQLSTLRGNSRIPGVIYGGEKPAINVALSEKELMEARKKGGMNAILHLQVGKGTETVIIKELQRHPVTDRPVHADFQRISLTQKIEAKVPLRIVGEAPGVKNSGGTMQHELRELRIRALPTQIPLHIDVDVSHVEINGHIMVKDLKIAPELELLDSPEHMVLSVTIAKIIEAAAPAAAPAAEGAAAAATAAEPESASTKGKKDEEGKLVKETAKAGAPAEKGKEPAKKEGK